MTRVLWIVQDGVLAGPGASQTVPYLRGLAGERCRPRLLSFEEARFLADRERVARVRGELTGAGVPWTALPRGSGPAAARTAVQVARGVAAGRGIVARERIDLVHARSYVPALLALGIGRPFLFDMRGLWPRERVDGGIWREGSAMVRLWTRLERVLLARAAGVVLLAEAGRDLLPSLSVPVRVIPTAVDLARFRPGLPPPSGAEHLVGRPVYAVAGALGTWYRLDAMLDLLALALREDSRAHALVLTEEDPAPALRGLATRGVPRERVTVRGVPHAEVPRWFSLAAAGILFIESAPSKRASMPTKLGEFLAAGTPVILSPGIGDTEALVSETRTGVVVREFSERGYGAALRELEQLGKEGPALTRRCREAARERLDLARAVRELGDLYREIACA